MKNKKKLAADAEWEYHQLVFKEVRFVKHHHICHCSRGKAPDLPSDRQHESPRPARVPVSGLPRSDTATLQ